MAKKYPEAEQTFQALRNLRANENYVSFDKIFEEVKKIRIARNLKEDTKNLKGRVRRSLVNTKESAQINKSEQSQLLNIPLEFSDYIVLSKSPIQIKESGLVKSTHEVESNSFKLVKIEK